MRYVKKSDGTFNGSVGDGRDHAPTSAALPPVPTLPSGDPAAGAVALSTVAASVRADAGEKYLAKMNALPDVHLRALEPFPGATTTPWRLVCVVCEKRGCIASGQCPAELLIRVNNITRGQRYACCCHKRTLTHDEAVAVLELNLPGWWAPYPYPGRTTTPWMVMCEQCGGGARVPLEAIRSSTNKPQCYCTWNAQSEQFLDQVDALDRLSVPQALVVDEHEPIPGTCRVCGDPVVVRMDALTAGLPVGCSCDARGTRALTDAEARARVLAKFPDTEFLEPYPGNRDRVWNMRCTRCGQASKPRLGALLREQVNTIGCDCATIGRARHSADRVRADLQAQHPDLAILDGDGDGTTSTWTVRCPSGHVTTTTAAVLKASRNGCSECRATCGYDPSITGYLYVLHGSVNGRPVLKFGITNYPEDRLGTHRKTGLRECVLLLEFTDGAAAKAVEDACKRMRVTASIPHCTDEGVKFDGSTETVFLDSPGHAQFAAQVIARVQAMRADLDGRDIPWAA